MKRSLRIMAVVWVATVAVVFATPDNAQALTQYANPISADLAVDTSAMSGTVVKDGLNLQSKLGLLGLGAYAAYTVWSLLNQSDYHAASTPSPSQGALANYLAHNAYNDGGGHIHAAGVGAVSSWGVFTLSQGFQVEIGSVIGADQNGTTIADVLGYVTAGGNVAGTCPPTGTGVNTVHYLCGFGMQAMLYTSPQDTGGGQCPPPTGCNAFTDGGRGQDSYTKSYPTGQVLSMRAPSNWATQNTGYSHALSLAWQTGWDNPPMVASTTCEAPTSGWDPSSCKFLLTYGGAGPVTGTATETLTCDPPYGTTGAQQNVTTSWPISLANPSVATCTQIGANWTPRKVVITIPGVGTSEEDFPAATGQIRPVDPTAGSNVITGVNASEQPNRTTSAPAPDGTNTKPDTQPTPVVTPTGVPSSTPPDSCHSMSWSLNPLNWMFDAVKNALSWAFVPCAWPNLSVANPIPSGWLPSFPALGDGACGTVTIPSLSLGWRGMTSHPATLFNTCNAPWPLVRSLTYYGLLAGVLVTVGLRSFRAVTGAFGMSVDGMAGGGEDE